MKRTEGAKKRIRILSAFLCAVLLVSAPGLPLTALPEAQAITQADIDALKKDADKLASEKKDLESKLAALSDSKEEAVKKKDLLDRQVDNTVSQIRNLESQIQDYNTLISQTEGEIAQAENELAQAEAAEAAQYELFCKRVRSMEEQGKTDYWSVLFHATDFSDLLSRLDIINEIMDADQRVIDQLNALQAEIAARQADLESKKETQENARTSLQGAKTDLEAQKSKLDTQRSAANAVIQEIEDNENEYEDTLDAIAAEEEAIQDRIVALSKQLAAEQGSSNAALGGYIWPVSSRRITSPFGKRNTGISGASTNHKGVDIGGVGYTSSVYATKAGTVIVSAKSSSYGNYVVISHGSGNTTLYGHMSSRKVSTGDYVSQGDVIGITGSTGVSSGPHLHFEITEKSVRVDPLQYLTGYVKAW